MSQNYLGAFCNQLIRFFEELKETYPEEKSIAMALEALVAGRRANPKLILDVFHEYIVVPAGDMIIQKREDEIIKYAKRTVETQFNDIMVALVIFDKYWPSMSPSNREAIWKYLQVLVTLAQKARAS
jgi:hypothetical protein